MTAVSLFKAVAPAGGGAMADLVNVLIHGQNLSQILLDTRASGCGLSPRQPDDLLHLECGHGDRGADDIRAVPCRAPRLNERRVEPAWIPSIGASKTQSSVCKRSSAIRFFHELIQMAVVIVLSS
ncbi:uncharacterized protein J3R85_012865 [Psidium guajava]|nr:uncharacterized protein J3R85_012865 [Psidium guajava]